MTDTPRQIYDLVIGAIRTEDQANGHQFLERYLQGSQDVWQIIQDRIFELPNLWSVTDCPDAQLQFLKNIVGWTSEYDFITRDLSYDDLRALISISGRLWKFRGPEDTILDVMFFTTGARNRIWNWFDMRWILDETEMGEEHEGRDPWLLDLPEPDTAGAEHESNLRIVDDGSLNKTLVANLLKLMRASNERWEITYLLFLDQFIIDGDDAQWTKPAGTSLTVASGKLTLLNTGANESTFVGEAGADSYSWSDYVFSARVQSAGGDYFGLYFYYVDSTHYWKLQCSVDGKEIELISRNGAGSSTLATADLSLEPYYPDVWYTYRIHAEWTGSKVRARVYLDNNEIIDEETDDVLDYGTIGLYHDGGATIECDDVEVFGLPIDSDFVDINP